MRKPLSGSTVASPKGALVSVGQVKTSALHIYYITKMLLCYFAVCVHFAPAAAVLRPVQAVVSRRWLPDWQHPYARPSQCVCGKSLTSVAVYEILTRFVKWNIFFSFSMMCHNPVPTTWCCLKKKKTNEFKTGMPVSLCTIHVACDFNFAGQQGWVYLGLLSLSPSHHSDMYVLFMGCGELHRLTSLSFCASSLQGVFHCLTETAKLGPKAFYKVGDTFKTWCFTPLLV